MGTNAHSWDLSIEEASSLQKRLREQVIEVDSFDGLHYVAGIDLSGVKSSGKATAAAILLAFPSLEIVEEHIVRDYLRFPYISGFLSFREAPLMVEALRGLKLVPDLILVDGQGRAHPRGLGIASHLGLLLDRPTIGCAKSRLVGRYAEPAEEAGNREPLLYAGKEIGSVLRTKSGVKPIFVSVGHRVSLPTAVEVVLRCTRPNQRIPEPTRQAHLAAGRAEEQ